MPTKYLTTPFARDETTQRSYKFGGGANTITTKNGILDDLDPKFEPYSIGYLINAGGGDDSISGSDIGAPGSGVGDTLIGGTGSDTISGGLGDDTIFGGNEDGTDGGKGKDPVVSNNLTGDNEKVLFDGGTYTGGNDTIFGGNGVTNNIYGDVRLTVVFSAGDSFFGGDDTLTGGDSTANDMAFNNIFGDARSVFFTAGDGANGESFTGGDDTLTGGNGAANLLFGDIQSFSHDGDFTGGNDTLIGGANGSNTMIGDISSGGPGNTVTGGDDRLVSGENSNDFMTGDFGSGVTATTLTGGDDTFVFGVDNGLDTITDFELAEFDGDEVVIDKHDVVELNGIVGVDDFLDDIKDNFTDSDGNTVLDLGGGNQITFIGLSGADFSADDFIFAA